MSFVALGLIAPLLRAVKHCRFEKPTEIQNLAIPRILEGADVLVGASTGSGKTAAFALPILQKIMAQGPVGPQYVRALVLVPTRELALQVTAECNALALFSPVLLDALALIGGESVDKQTDDLKKGVSVVVATPGRLQDLMERGAVNLSRLEVLVLDEADRILEAGFAESLAAILSKLPSKRQSLLFSATFPQKLVELNAQFLVNPVEIVLNDEIPVVETIEQRIIEVNREKRRPLLCHLIQTEKWESALVFVASHKAAENMSIKLKKDGVNARAFHGDLPQEDRVALLNAFRNRKIRVLISTDLAARGIDISGLSHVVNYDLPRSPSTYIHRIGRTGRMGQVGMAVTFVGHEDQAHFALIEKKAKIQLPREQVLGFELQGKAPVKTNSGPIKGKRPNKKEKLRAKNALEFAEENLGE